MTGRIKVIFKGRPLWLFVAGVAAALLVGAELVLVTGQGRPIIDINDTLMLAGFGGLGAFVANLYVQRGQDLTRIGKLEDALREAQNDLHAFRTENEGLRDNLRAAASFIDRVGLWVLAGMPASKRPRPPQQLAEHIDAELWEDPAVGGTD